MQSQRHDWLLDANGRFQFHHLPQTDLVAHPVQMGQALDFARPDPMAFDGGLSAPHLLSSTPTMQDEITYIAGADSTGKIALISFRCWNYDDPPTYGPQSSLTKWGNTKAGTGGGTVTYNFDPASSWTTVEKAEITDTLALWSSIVNIKFVHDVHVTSDIHFYRNGSGQGTYTSNIPVLSLGSPGDSKIPQTEFSNLYFDTTASNVGPMDGSLQTKGGTSFQTLLHEEGHMLGLGHGGPYDGGFGAGTFSAFDITKYALMSYNPDVSDWGFNAAGDGLNGPTTPMLLDIAAAQRLYGAATGGPLAKGGITFGFNCNLTGPVKMFYDFTVNTCPVVTLYAGGTGNVLDASGYTTASQIDLHQGAFSSMGSCYFTSTDKMTNNVCIAFGTKIDTAFGGSGSDTLVANDDGDRLVGNKGADKLVAGLGADTLVGGPGNDRFVFHAAKDSPGTAYDTVKGVEFRNGDKFDVHGHITAIDPTFAGTFNAATFDSRLVLKLNHLGAGHAEMVHVTGGDMAGDYFLVIDQNGIEGYQSGHDLVIRLEGIKHPGLLDPTDFV